MRQLFVAGLSTSSGLVDSLTWLLQIKQAGTRDAYDSTLKAPLNPPTTAIIPPPPLYPLFPPVSQASQGSSDRRKSASGLFQVSQIRDGGDFLFPYSPAFLPWALIRFLALDGNLIFLGGGVCVFFCRKMNELGLPEFEGHLYSSGASVSHVWCEFLIFS